ncbi:MAG: bifunctional 5,10-methylenetetrahydrofolate dehydrogenase/5,10-methenyltetrahydrofolate cyclohydrolase [bacterium]
MKILDGKKIALELIENIKKKTDESSGRLKLAFIQVGKSRAGEGYLKQKKKACELAGIRFELIRFKENVKESVLITAIRRLNKKRDISGIVAQLPLPSSIDAQAVLDSVSIQKDPDCLSQTRFAKFCAGRSIITPPVVSAIDHLLSYYHIDIKGKKVVVIGSGRLVGRPLAMWLLNNDATYSVLNTSTPKISTFTKIADIIITGAGRPGLLTGRMVKGGVTIIDAGSGYKNGKVSGDADWETVSKKARYITPVPGGIGPLTVACLLENLVILNGQKEER